MWLEFYEHLTQADDSSIKNVYTDALDSKDYPYRIFNLEKDFKILFDVDDEKFQYFAMREKIFLMIPLKNIHGNIFGFVCRSISGNRFYNIQIEERFPMVFGLETLARMPFNTPILLCEGIKDCMTLRQVYPVSLAYLTAKPSDLLFNFLKQISKKVVFFPDNDKAGQNICYDRDVKEKKYIKDKEVKEKFEFYAKHYTPYGKDLGEYWDDTIYKERILQWVKSMLLKDDIQLPKD